MTKNIGFHTRLDGDNKVKVVGGSFGGSLDLETANRLVRSHFTVVVNQCGRPVFVDREGRRVSLYISVDPQVTDAGVEAMALYRKDQARKSSEREAQEESERNQVEELMSGLTHDEIVKRLKGN